MLTYLRRQHLALIALFVALSSTSYAAITIPRNSVGPTQIRGNAVTSAKVKDRSLLAKDFKAGQLPAGPQGDKGDKGDKGDPGATGAMGATGTVDTSSFFTKGESDGRFIQNQSGAPQSGSLFVDGTVRTSGALRLGSETGTSQGPNLPGTSAGLVIRRAFSDNQSNNQVVARVDAARFERDASSGVAFRLDNADGTSPIDMDCFGVNVSGNPLSKRMTIAAGVDALALTGADGAEGFTCSFLAVFTGAETQLTLQRRESSSEWVGTLISTDNQ
jgi:hypothetical protein